MAQILNKLKKPLTLRGHRLLANEHTDLLAVQRPRLVENLAKAAAEGDRSENAEYIYTKKRIREIDYRIRYLEKLLKDAQKVDPRNVPIDGEVFFSTQVTIEDSRLMKQRKWTIVGEGETDFFDD